MIGAGGRDGKQLLVHRWIWEQANGPIPDGLFVCHRDDDPLNVNLDNLFLGTHSDNMQDMLAKGRGRYQKRAP